MDKATSRALLAVGSSTCTLCMAVIRQIPDPTLAAGPGALFLVPLVKSPWTFAALAGVAVALQMVPLLALGRKRAIRNFMNRVHSRFWNVGGGRDPDYRISIFRPYWGRLACYYRSDGNEAKASWSKKCPTDGRDADGFVGFVWRYGLSKSVAALPTSPTAEQVSLHQAETFVTSEQYQKLSWKGAAMLGMTIESPSGDGPVAVFLVECRKPGATISANGLVHDVGICAMIWEGRL